MEKSGRPRLPSGVPGWLLLWLVPLALAGCSAPTPERTVADPFLGKAAAPVRSAAQGSPYEPAVPYPPSSSTGPAALAGGGKQPFDATHDLRIASADTSNPGAKPASDPAWKGSRGVAGDPTPSKPDPFPAPTPGGAIVPVSLSAARINTLDQGWAYLRAHGATYQRLTTRGEDGQIECSCSLPNPQNPNLRRTYEASARDPLTALRAVIDQIEKEQNQH
jgi:hypothetical protein